MPTALPTTSESRPASAHAPGLWAGARRIAFHRPWRVTAVLAAVVALSLVDLDLTLLYSTTLGMVEINPIARSIMGLGSIWMVVTWKLFTAGTAVGILYYTRRHATGELGAWICLATLVWLTGRWMNYNHDAQVLNNAETREAVARDPEFVMLGTE
ncbi:MAG: hypothetical protein AABZ53_05930 [Planctomycetota bacterium]